MSKTPKFQPIKIGKEKMNLSLPIETKEKLIKLREIKQKNASELVVMWVDKEWKAYEKKQSKDKKENA